MRIITRQRVHELVDQALDSHPEDARDLVDEFRSLLLAEERAQWIPPEPGLPADPDPPAPAGEYRDNPDCFCHSRPEPAGRKMAWVRLIDRKSFTQKWNLALPVPPMLFIPNPPGQMIRFDRTADSMGMPTYRELAI